MTLHEAIQQVLKNENRAMSTKEIADRLNENKLYTKKDNSPIQIFKSMVEQKIIYIYLIEMDQQFP